MKFYACLGFLLLFVSYSKETNLANISYTLWIGNDIHENHTIFVKAPVNTTFFEVMQIAAEQNPENYRFKSLMCDFGHYINEIGGYHDDKWEGVYWFIYLDRQLPNPQNPPTEDMLTSAVDYVRIQDKEDYLFWYKKVENNDPNQEFCHVTDLKQ